MEQNFKTVIFDLDGTIYQNTTFHTDYIHYLVEDTALKAWTTPLIQFCEGVFTGENLVMNEFYSTKAIKAESPEQYFAALEENILEAISYEQALVQDDLLFLGDAWAVLTLIGETLDLFGNGRQDLIYRKTREKMEQRGMEGNVKLKKAIVELTTRCNVILLSNSYEQTAREFLRQLGFARVFPVLGSSANKPFEMISKLEELDANIFSEPQAVLSIGDHAFNDLMPIERKGGSTVWINPFKNIAKAKCDLELACLDELAEFLHTLAR